MKAAWFHIAGILCIHTALAQGFQDLRFTHLTDKDGLSNNKVTAIAQDTDGIIWIGTENGLNRFDGYGFRSFFAGQDQARAIPNNFITMIAPGRSNDLWVSTTEGVFRFDTRSQESRAFGPIPGDKGAFRTPYRPFLFMDTSLYPWVTTGDGLYHFLDSTRYVHLDEGLKDFPEMADKSIVPGQLVDDRKGHLWSWSGNLIFRFGPSKRVDRVVTCARDWIVKYLYFDRLGRCWVCTWGKGLFLFDTVKGIFQPFHTSETGSIVLGAAEWSAGGKEYIVFTCSLPGALFVDERDLSLHIQRFDPVTMFLGNAPFVDKQDILWIPSSDGVYYVPPSDNLFSVIPVSDTITKHARRLPSYVYNMRETAAGFWIAKRPGGGMLWYDKEWKLRASWPEIPVRWGPGSINISAGTPEAFDFLQRGDSLFVTTEGGISILSLRTRAWTVLRPPDVPKEPRLRNIEVGNDTTWWIRSYNSGVFLFNPKTRLFTRHYLNGDSCANCLPPEINYLLGDQTGRVMVTTGKGLFRYDKRADAFQRVDIRGGPVLSRRLFGMAFDRTGILWVGAENGLYALDPQSGRIVKTFKENTKIGLVFRICTDEEQNIWFTSNSGYWCWLRHSDKVVHFEYGLGLPKVDEGIFYEGEDGSVYGGGRDALVRFYSDRLLNYKVDARAKIMEAIVNDTLAPIIPGEDGQKELVMSPDESSLDIDFDVINYDLISSNQFFYRLNPGGKDWQQSESGHLYFYNLQPGAYDLEVRGASRMTGQTTNTDNLRIVIRPRWYQTDWFKLCCVLTAGLVVFFLLQYRIRMVRREGSIKQKMTEIEMTALRAQMNPHFIFNSLNSIENFIMHNDKRQASDYLNKFATLIRLILENSRKQAVPIAQDMEAMQLYVDLERLRFDGKFRYTADIDRILMEGDYRVAPLLIQPFVENAIVHGLAPSDQEDLCLQVLVRLQGERIHYTIKDNGIGRSASMEYNKRRKIGHKSLGLEISRERIGNNGTLEIIDLYHEDGSTAGTRVSLTIKIA